MTEPSAEARAAADDLARDRIYEALVLVENELSACLAALKNDDDTGARYHFRRMVLGVKDAAGVLNEMLSQKAEAA
jgi:hypothetical protein